MKLLPTTAPISFFVSSEAYVEEQRFEFGKNWQNYLQSLTPERIEEAEQSLSQNLGAIRDKTFLDIGSGSGLFSLAARRLGAKVTSFDYDVHSVACTNFLKNRYFPDDNDWSVFQGSVLDHQWLHGLGQFDIVYSWGVLHHTGSMWDALKNVTSSVAPNGRLFLAIYNDQAGYSKRWLKIKRAYIACPPALRTIYAGALFSAYYLKPFLSTAIRLKNPFSLWSSNKQDRGMSLWTNWIDWIGGYPFEVATPDAIFNFYKKEGFTLSMLKTCGGGLGCNEFIFTHRKSS